MSDWLEEIEARLNAATPGPWDDMGSDDAKGLNGMYAGCVVSIEYDDSPMMMPTRVTVVCRDPEYDDRPEDRDFIAHAREDIPRLIARVRELEAQAARDARVAEAATRLIDEGVPMVAHEYAGLECAYCGAVRYSHGIEHSPMCKWEVLRATLAAREEQ